ncbi:putative F-box domain-containing protein [Helianthus anomalus]
MPNLPTDVIISDILTRVPTKTAARSKSVCKEWRALLSTRDFEKAYCSHTLTPSNQRTLLTRDLNMDDIYTLRDKRNVVPYEWPKKAL